jgi:hypothetical protein
VVLMACGCFFIALNVVVSRRGSDWVGVSYERGWVSDLSFLGTEGTTAGVAHSRPVTVAAAFPGFGWWRKKGEGGGPGSHGPCRPARPD